jgi:hypothetical protein
MAERGVSKANSENAEIRQAVFWCRLRATCWHLVSGTQANQCWCFNPRQLKMSAIVSRRTLQDKGEAVTLPPPPDLQAARAGSQLRQPPPAKSLIALHGLLQDSAGGEHRESARITGTLGNVRKCQLTALPTNARQQDATRN